MRLGWFVSLLAHAAFLFAGIIVWPHKAKPLPEDSAIVPIDVVDFAERSNVTPVAPKASEISEELLEAGAPKAGQQADPELAEPIAAPPSIKPPSKKPDTPKPAFDPNKIRDLLADLSQKQRGDAPRTAGPAAEIGEKPRSGFGAQTALTASIKDYLAAVFENCWRSTADMPDPERLRVKVRFALNRDGTLLSNPQVVSVVLPGDTAMRVAADNALRAVRTCGPYRLPTDSYAQWRELELTFGVKGLIQ